MANNLLFNDTEVNYPSEISISQNEVSMCISGTAYEYLKQIQNKSGWINTITAQLITDKFGVFGGGICLSDVVFNLSTETANCKLTISNNH